MGITPFFVENVSELQLCAIKLVTAVSLFWFFLKSCTLHCTPGAETPLISVNIHVCVICAYSFAFLHRLTRFFCFYPQVFSRYEKHRQLILEEIFTSLARLPTSKRSLRNFRYVLLF